MIIICDFQDWISGLLNFIRTGVFTLLTNHLDFRLEPKVRELYEEHKMRAEKIDWGYHEFLPWDKAQDFRRVPWDESQVTLPGSVITAVETALLTEVNLPWFTSYLDQTFKGSLTVIKEFVHTWTAEEDQHSNLLETYLLITRNVNPDRLHQLHKQTLENGWNPDFHTPFETMVYTSMQLMEFDVGWYLDPPPNRRPCPFQGYL